MRIKTFFTHKTCILAALVRETGLFTHAISTLVSTLTQCGESENLLLGNCRHELLQVERLEIRYVLELLIRQQLASWNQH